MSHWSSGPPVCFPSQGTQVQIPWVVLMWNRDSPVSIVSLIWWPWRDWSLWPRQRRASSWTVTGPSCQRCDNPTWSHTAFLSQVTLAASFPSGFTTEGVGCWGVALCRACNLTSFSPCLTGPVEYLFASCHKGPGFKSPRGTYVKWGFSC
jgi:hypothetical protein